MDTQQTTVDAEYYGMEPWERDRVISPTENMTIGQRIAHVGGVITETQRVEFGSVMAVKAFADHLMRDMAAPKGADMKSLVELVNEQASDEGLWFVAESITEGYLQQALRKLHAAIEVQAAHKVSPLEKARQTIHCKDKRDNNGVCPNHNLQCGWPDCNKPPKAEPLRELSDEEIDNIDQSMCGERECHIPFALAILAAARGVK